MYSHCVRFLFALFHFALLLVRHFFFSTQKKCSSSHPVSLHSSCILMPDNLPVTTFPREHRDVTEQRFRAQHAGQPEGVAPVTANTGLWCDSPPPFFFFFLLELVRLIAQSCRVCVQVSANEGPGFIQRDTHTQHTQAQRWCTAAALCFLVHLSSLRACGADGYEAAALTCMTWQEKTKKIGQLFFSRCCCLETQPLVGGFQAGATNGITTPFALPSSKLLRMLLKALSSGVVCHGVMLHIDRKH